MLTVQTDKVLQVRIFKKINMFLWTREKKLEFYDIIKKNVKKKDGKAFAGESQTRNCYTYYASVANKEGYKQIKNIDSSVKTPRFSIES